MMITTTLHYCTQQCFAISKFFASCNSHCCFDRSGLHSSIGLQDTVDNTRKTEKEMGSSRYDDGYGGHQYDRERSSSSLLSYLVGDIIDRTDLSYIKGGSLFLA